MSRIKEAKKILLHVAEQLPVLSAFGSIAFGTAVASAASERQQIDPNTNCPVGETPHFILGFAALKEVVGDAMGNPLECEHGRPDNKDTNQKTTKGLAYWRANINAKSFTDGFRHWQEQNGIYVYWEGEDIEAPATATPVTPEAKPPSLESFISESKLTGQLKIDQNHQMEVRSSPDAAFTLSLNPTTNDQFITTLKSNGLDKQYGKIEAIIVSSPTATPVEWASTGMTQVNMGYYRGTGVADFVSIGTFHSLSHNGDLIFFFAPNPELKLDNPAVSRAVNDTIARRLFAAVLNGGSLAARDPLLGRTDFLNLAGLDPFVISSIQAQN